MSFSVIADEYNWLGRLKKRQVVYSKLSRGRAHDIAETHSLKFKKKTFYVAEEPYGDPIVVCKRGKCRKL